MPKKNIPLLKRLRTRFLRMRHPEHFNMNSFADKTSCGTSMCIAGHALNLQGYKVRLVPDKRFGDYDDTWYSPAGRKVHPDKAAQREMGLSRAEANNLFYSESIDTPKQAAARIEQLINEAQANRELKADPRFKEIIEQFNAEIIELVGSMDHAPRFQTDIGAGIGIIKLKGGRKAEIQLHVNADRNEWIKGR